MGGTLEEKDNRYSGTTPKKPNPANKPKPTKKRKNQNKTLSCGALPLFSFSADWFPSAAKSLPLPRSDAVTEIGVSGGSAVPRVCLSQHCARLGGVALTRVSLLSISPDVLVFFTNWLLLWHLSRAQRTCARERRERVRSVRTASLSWK